MGDRPTPMIWRPPRWFRRGMVVLTAYLLALGAAVSYGFMHQDDQIDKACQLSRRADKALARDVIEAIGAELDAEPERVERVVDDTIRRADARYGC